MYSYVLWSFVLLHLASETFSFAPSLVSCSWRSQSMVWCGFLVGAVCIFYPCR